MYYFKMYCSFLFVAFICYLSQNQFNLLLKKTSIFRVVTFTSAFPMAPYFSPRNVFTLFPRDYRYMWNRFSHNTLNAVNGSQTLSCFVNRQGEKRGR